MNLASLVGVARSAYPDEVYPKPLDSLVPLHDVVTGAKTLDDLRPHVRKRVAGLMGAADPVATAFDVDLGSLPPKTLQKARKGEAMLAQLVLGTLGEQAFEAIYRSKLGGTEFKLDDYRETRNDTDYRVLNGGGRPLFRINSKFHGTLFKKAHELVGLDSEDCFALATYKIWSATQKEREEHLPYLFLVISSPITTESVVGELPEDHRTMARLFHASEKAVGKRSLEERLVRGLLAEPGRFAERVKEWQDQLAASQWRVLSAQRAVALLREKLFARVFALRTRNFNIAFRNAELDMHFSLSEDMTPLEDVLEILQREGSQGVVGRAIKGVI